jgi:hypothetical protein
MSPDPKMGSAHASNPQSLNRYTYVDNNPLKYFDPDGMEKQLTIYVNQPVFGKRTLMAGAGNYGHAFLGLRDAKTGVERKFGFWPTGKGALIGGGGHTSGELHDETSTAWMVKKTFTISDDSAKKLAASINSQLPQGSAPDYDMKTNNCATWVVDEAGIAGVNITTRQGTDITGNSADDPGDLGQDLRDQGGEVNPALASQNGQKGSSDSSSGPPGGDLNQNGMPKSSVEKLQDKFKNQ